MFEVKPSIIAIMRRPHLRLTNGDDLSITFPISRYSAAHISMMLNAQSFTRSTIHHVLMERFKLDDVAITNGENEIYEAYAVLDGIRLEVMPSDAVFLALIAGIPIHASESLFRNTDVDLSIFEKALDELEL